MAKLYPLTDWADDRDGWDTDTGAPGIVLFGNAVQVWAVMQNRARVTVAEAAAAFNVDPRRVAEAVHEHRWMLLVGPGGDVRKEDDAGNELPLPASLDYSRITIEHEGE